LCRAARIFSAPSKRLDEPDVRAVGHVRDLFSPLAQVIVHGAAECGDAECDRVRDVGYVPKCDRRILMSSGSTKIGRLEAA
jgi:hypothetical protein